MMSIRLKTLAVALIALCICASANAVPTTVKHIGLAWQLENGRLKVTIDPSEGTISVLDKISRYIWRQPDGKSVEFANVCRISEGVRFNTLVKDKDRAWNLIVSLRLPHDASDLCVEAGTKNLNDSISSFLFLKPLVLDSPDAVLAVADYCDGHIYPLSAEPFPRTYFDGDRLDMPWVGVCDLKRGQGYAIILETSDDSWVQCNKWTLDSQICRAPQVGWQESWGKLRYPRKMIYRFVPSGGYVALAKAYRSYAKKHGLLVTLAQKMKSNPNTARLFGAPDVWGDASVAFARAAKAAGVEKMIIHGRCKDPHDMKTIDGLGYLTSEYDNYTDVVPLEHGREVDSSHDRIPQRVVLNADGSRMTAWLTFDKKTQYMKRCPIFWLTTARQVIPKALQEYPFLGRFIDVTTAERLYECHDPNHPLTNTQKRICGQLLLGFVKSCGLVVGGEHGIWWAVPHEDYIEGMMSGNRFAWPAGHLIRPKTRQDEFGPIGSNTTSDWEIYDKWSLGHEWRAPLWELVFHDCVVSTWYWGDSSDFLLDADPEYTLKKDAFNVLYGTIPLLWASKEGAWTRSRESFLRTYRNTCKLHEVVAGTELLTHKYLTQDHDVQYTRFSDGTRCIANFGESVRKVELGGRDYNLPQYGFAVKGPGIEQSRVLVDGRVVTTIRTRKYYYCDK